jgi:hypothetical protein
MTISSITIAGIALVLAALSVGCTLHEGNERKSVEHPPSAERIFELRTYTASPGKLDALNARFREHTNALFVKHGMTLVGFFTPAEGDRKNDTLVYILAFPDRASREQAWTAFRADPEWQRAKAESEVNGPLTTKIESVLLAPTDYSALR